jgi:hypothetical protein
VVSSHRLGNLTWKEACEASCLEGTLWGMIDSDHGMVSEVQFYTMVDQAATAVDAMEFNYVDDGCTVKNCKYFMRKINLGLDRIILCCESD